MSNFYNVKKTLSNTLEKLGGSEVAKPHSTKKGRIEAGVRKLVRKVKKGGFKKK